MESTFDTALDGLDKVGASVIERKLVGMMAQHGEQEGALLKHYQRFTETAGSPAVQYLVSLIVDEEQKHHRMLVEMANAIAWGGYCPTNATPDIFHREVPESPLSRETQELLAAEERDQSELRRLSNELEPYQHTTMWRLLVDLMLLDTNKHTAILRFISKYLT